MAGPAGSFLPGGDGDLGKCKNISKGRTALQCWGSCCEHERVVCPAGILQIGKQTVRVLCIYNFIWVPNFSTLPEHVYSGVC